MTELNYEKLNDLRIHELRDLARSMGVQSPTSKKKEDIIEEVLAIMNGKSEPYVSKTKQGRPAKTKMQYGAMIDFLMPKNDSEFEISNFKFDNEFESMNAVSFEFMINSPQVSFNEDLATEKTEEVAGYLDIKKNGYGVLRVDGFTPTDKDIFVHMFLIKNHNLQSGDYILGFAEKVEEDKPLMLTKIKLLNSKLVNTIRSGKTFDDFDYEMPTRALSADNNEFNYLTQLKEGTRNFIVKEGIDFGYLNTLAKSFDESEYTVFVININAMPEEKSYKQNNIVFENIGFNVSEDVLVSTVNLVIEHAKRLIVCEDKKVVVIVNNFAKYLKSVNTLNDVTNTKKLRKDTEHYAKNFIMCAKNIDDNKNLTLMLMDELKIEKEYQEFFEYELLKLFNSVVK